MSEDFAALLRELKERSGLSYGVLARRLHMSTSTLHRYCNGDAVPAEYAPVERLARLCKASPEELVELHRRWVLADAGRGQRKAAPAAPGPGPVPVPAQVQIQPEPKPRTGQEARPEAEAEPETQAGPEAEAEAGVQPQAGTEAGAGAQPQAGTEAGQEPGPDPGPEPRLRPAPPAARRRRRTALLAAATVAALLGAVALAVSLPSEEFGQTGQAGRPGQTGQPAGAGPAGDGRRGPVAAASSGGGAREAATPPTAASPSPSGFSAERRRGPSAASDARSAPAKGDKSPAAGVPLTVTTRPYAWENPCSQHYLIDSPPDEVPPPPVEQDAPAWVASQWAVSAGEQYVTLTVQGTGQETVVVEDLKVRVVGRGAPLSWNDYAMGVGCGGDVPTRPFTIALDAARPTVKAAAGGRDFPFKVSESDPEVFHITADASAYDVRWYLELTWSSGSRGGTLLIGDGGEPLRTSGNNGRPAYDFPLGGSGWSEAMVDAG